MHHQRDKYNQISIVSLLLAFLIGLFAMIKSYQLIILFSLYLLTLSIVTEALLLNMSLRKTESIKQLIRGLILFILISYLFIKFVRGS
ncbi:hypothetical protein ACFSKI_05805 [Pseudogracilibacillus auburnensis]|uniref:Uncharacterized protein n=1 Tax=Pseudogracilibacillus auburnensis TaxID=1494959 RepID=A0A2V3W2R3_9BACI|nr:hypothetical protein [Pseudogracilibacillus auburnensis]MBO1002094.1 hypothetical protein [Pseudogracilibacillus auburnensis]PXW87418.1 hypothetical protein DFR56_10557 [Pseudogracilibacillus auburnensis]